MKIKKLFFLISFVFTVNSYSQPTFQKNIGVTNNHYHDINLEPINDGSGDYIVASNLFDALMQNEELSLKRVDQNGNIVWIKKYTHSTFQHARIFDVENYQDFLIITGSIDVNGTKRVFIAKLEATTGTLLQANYYDILSPNLNSRGLHISYTESDANGDGQLDPGFIVGGFFSDCYNLDTNCINNNFGFVMRTDFNLNLIWTIELDVLNNIDNQDYDFVNNVIETSNGYFIAGSATGITNNNIVLQAVLAHKVDFMGNFVWDQSYILGNSRDVSVDAYFDSATSEIYMLCNYSVSHYFGVTVLNNTSGVIDFSRSWYSSANDLNRYGFTIMESANSIDNLIITGYDRDENWVDINNNSFYGESNLFVHEFDKATGNQVGQSYQYLVPHIEPAGDEFNFWFWQMPLIYYPDISIQYGVPGMTPDYFHVGYRTDPPGSFTETELFRTTPNKRNDCENLDLILTPNPISIQFSPVTSAFIPNTETVLVLNDIVLNYTEEFCDPTLSVGDIKLNNTFIYPNPVSDILYFSTDNLSSYTILDFLGRTIMEGTLTTNKSIELSTLQNGIYFIKIIDENSISQIVKFIKK